MLFGLLSFTLSSVSVSMLVPFCQRFFVGIGRKSWARLHYVFLLPLLTRSLPGTMLSADFELWMWIARDDRRASSRAKSRRSSRACVHDGRRGASSLEWCPRRPSCHAIVIDAVVSLPSGGTLRPSRYCMLIVELLPLSCLVVLHVGVDVRIA